MTVVSPRVRQLGHGDQRGREKRETQTKQTTCSGAVLPRVKGPAPNRPGGRDLWGLVGGLSG